MKVKSIIHACSHSSHQLDLNFLLCKMKSAGQNIFVGPNILGYADISRALRKQEGGEGSSDIVGVRRVFCRCLGVPEKCKLSPRSVAPLPGFDHDRAGRTGSRTSRLPHEVSYVPGSVSRPSWAQPQNLLKPCVTPLHFSKEEPTTQSKILVQDHIAHESQNQDLNPGGSNSRFWSKHQYPNISSEYWLQSRL